MDGLRHALRFALSRQANAYGFTLVVWGTGALAIWALDKPDPADVFAFIGGALVSISLIVAAVFGVRQPFRVERSLRRPFSAMHLPSVPAAILAGWGLTIAVQGVPGFFVSSAAAVAVCQLLLSLEVAFALAPRHAARGEEGHARSR